MTGMIDDPTSARQVDAGLCARCVHAHRVRTERGSLFFLCRLSATDPRFAKYPRLPVLRCDGFKDKEETGEVC